MTRCSVKCPRCDGKCGFYDPPFRNPEPKVCDCNQGRLPCNCKDPAGWPEDWKMAPPSPPSMRSGKQPTDIGGIIIIIIFAVAIGVACGWQMHGGVCS